MRVWLKTRNGMIVAASALVVVIAILSIALSGDSGNSGTSGMTPGSEEAANPDVSPEQRCVDLWNNDAGNASSGVNWAETLQRAGEMYVSVGFAADFPDKCLFTLAQPNYDTVTQFIESDPANTPGNVHTSGPSGGGSVSGLSEETKQWNATVAEDGTLTLTGGN
mgnify:FL=1